MTSPAGHVVIAPRARTNREILRDAFGLYRSNCWLLIGITAIATVPYYVILCSVPLGRTGGLSTSLGWLVAVFAGGSTSLAVFDICLGRVTSLALCYRRITRTSLLFPLVGAMFLFYVMTQVPSELVTRFLAKSPNPWLSLLSLPIGIWVIYSTLRLVLIIPSCVLERLGAVAALKRSWFLMSGWLARALWLYAFVFVALMTVDWAVLSIIGMAFRHGHHAWHASPWIVPVFGALWMLTVPLLSSISALLYFDIRSTKEGFDSEQLAQAIDALSLQETATGGSQ